MNEYVGQQLGNYRLLRLLGQGGFADVYLGEHIHLHTQAAIKILQMRLAEEHAEAFITEARTIAHLVHPNIVRVLDFGVQNSVPFLVMDYAPGGTLRQRMQAGKPLPPASLFPFIMQVASALQYAHDRKLMHRDVKPENMLIGVNGEVLLSDFGLALVTQSTGSRSTAPGGNMAGTATYMAPEQVQGSPRSASDQYALAVVVYEWLTGSRPFQGSFLEVATQQVLAPTPSLRAKTPTIPLALEKVVMRALAKEPQQRYPSVVEFAAALGQVCLQEGIIEAQTAQSAHSIISRQLSSGTSPSGSASQLTFLAAEATDQSAQSPFTTTPISASVQRQFIKTPSGLDFPSQEAAVETLVDPQEAQATFVKTPQSVTSTPLTQGLARRTPITQKNQIFQTTRTSQSLQKTQLVENASDEIVKALKQATHTNKVLLIVSLILVCVIVIGGGAGVWYFTHPPRHLDQPALGDQVANPYATHTGKLVFHDPLAANDAPGGNPNQWDDGQPCSFKGDSYHITLPMNQFATCYAHATNFKNFTYEVQMTFIKLGHTSSAAGIAFRGDNAIPATYQIQMFARGRYNFLACTATCRVVSSSPPQQQIMPGFHTGLGQSNTLAVVAHDDVFTFYVNGQRVFGPVQDHTSSHGMIGVYAQGGQGGNGVEVAFRNARVWEQ
jgi:serine/threonine protein kinase